MIKPWIFWASCGLNVALLAILAAHWAENPDAPSVEQAGKPGENVAAPPPSLTRANRSKKPETPKPSVAKAMPPVRNKDNLPADPILGIAQLQAKYSGKELGSKLWAAGRFYSRQGMEAVQAFILNAPPGVVGRQAVSGAAQGIPPEQAPELFAFLNAHSSELGERCVRGGLLDLFHLWGERHFDRAWAFASEQEVAHQTKVDWMAIALHGADEEAVIPTVNAIEDPELRQALLGSRASVEAYMEQGNYEIYSILEGQFGNRDVFHRLHWQIENGGHTKEAITALHAANLSDPKLLNAAVSTWVGRDTNAALDFLSSTENPELVSAVIEKSYNNIAESDLEAAIKWAEQIRDPQKRAQIVDGLKRRRR